MKHSPSQPTWGEGGPRSYRLYLFALDVFEDVALENTQTSEKCSALACSLACLIYKSGGNRFPPPKAKDILRITTTPILRSTSLGIVPYWDRPFKGVEAWRFPNFTLGCRTFATLCAVLEKLRWLGFPLTLHCFALFNHGQVTPFIVYIAAFGRFMRHSRIQKHFDRHMYSRCMVRSGEAVARAQTLGVQLQTGS